MTKKRASSPKLSAATVKALSAAAVAARDRAYAPYSGHPVGAAILADDGETYCGANVEVAHFKGICGEGSAISAMVMAGARRIVAVAVAGPADGKKLCTPCGDCRQRIYEFATPATVVISLDGAGKPAATHYIDELLPLAFGPENLKAQPAKKKKARKS